MKTDKTGKTNEKLIGGIAALAVAAVCVFVYFGVRTDHGSYDEPAPEGIAFAAPDATDGHVQIDDSPVPLSDSPFYEDELLEEGSLLSDGDDLSDDALYEGSDMLNEDTLLDNGDMLEDELLIDDSGSGNAGNDELLVEEPSQSNTSGNDNKKTDKKEEEPVKDNNNSSKDKDASGQSKNEAKDNSDKTDEGTNALDSMMLSKINDLRASVGAGKLTIDPTLNKYAAVRAQEASVTWSHTRPNGIQGCDMISSSKYRAENLSCRSYSSYGNSKKEQENAADAMFDNLKSSSSHYDNMTFKNFTKVGISTYITKTKDGKTRLTTAYLFSN